MDEGLAHEIADELLIVTESFNRLSHLTMQMTDESERRSYRKSLGTLMLDFNHELVRPITAKYPHLNPIKT